VPRFGSDIAGPVEAYGQAALDVWRAWKEFVSANVDAFRGNAPERERVRHGAERDAERCDAAAGICSAQVRPTQYRLQSARWRPATRFVLTRPPASVFGPGPRPRWTRRTPRLAGKSGLAEQIRGRLGLEADSPSDPFTDEHSSAGWQPWHPLQAAIPENLTFQPFA